MIEPKEALEIVLENCPRPRTVDVSIEQALGLVTTETIRSTAQVPAFNNSAMDGFALRAEDLKKVPVDIKVIDEVPAGKVSTERIGSKEAIKIMTGGLVPRGADCVVPVEDTREAKQKREGINPSPTVRTGFTPVLVNKSFKKGANIRLAGEDIKSGDVLVEKGTVIRPVQVGLMASVGITQVKIYQPPQIAILSTGSEIVEPSEDLKPGQVRDSNSYSLFSQIRQLGAVPLKLGIAPDNYELTKTKVKSGLKADILITTGGVSVGEYDFIKEILRELGAEQKFWSVAQKPGKPLAFWLLESKPVFGLPGNPVAVMLCFELYVRPLILKLMGYPKLFRPSIEAKLAHDFSKKKGRYSHQRVKLERKDDCLWAASTGNQGSGVLSSMVADGIVVLSKDSDFIKTGEMVEVILLRPLEEIC